MALVVSTAPPSLVVQTTVKRKPVQNEETPGFCDRFWACVLDDYLDEDVDDEAYEVGGDMEDRQDKIHTGTQMKTSEKHKKKKKKSRKKKQKEIPKLLDEHASLHAELETILSDDHEMDLREKEVIELEDQEEVVDEPIKEVPSTGENPEEDDPEEDTNQDLKDLKTHNNSIAKFPEYVDSNKFATRRVEAQMVGPTRRAPTPEIFHYAPFPYGRQGAEKSPADPYSNNEPEFTPRSTVERVPIDPEQMDSNRDEWPQNSTETGPKTVQFHRPGPGGIPQPLNLPRAPSGPRSPQFYSYPAAPRVPHRYATTRVLDTQGTRRVERIDLTMSSKRNQSGGNTERSKANGNTTDDRWSLVEMKRAEADGRRKKLDRKEALHRIRAIKARIQTIDP